MVEALPAPEGEPFARLTGGTPRLPVRQPALPVR